jgi:hypothetical protein
VQIANPGSYSEGTSEAEIGWDNVEWNCDEKIIFHWNKGATFSTGMRELHLALE